MRIFNKIKEKYRTRKNRGLISVQNQSNFNNENFIQINCQSGSPDYIQQIDIARLRKFKKISQIHSYIDNYPNGDKITVQICDEILFRQQNIQPNTIRVLTNQKSKILDIAKY